MLMDPLLAVLAPNDCGWRKEGDVLDDGGCGRVGEKTDPAVPARCGCEWVCGSRRSGSVGMSGHVGEVWCGWKERDAEVEWWRACTCDDVWRCGCCEGRVVGA
jgi:hypothetical protein